MTTETMLLTVVNAFANGSETVASSKHPSDH